MVGVADASFSPAPEGGTAAINVSQDACRESPSPSINSRKCGFWSNRSPLERIFMPLALGLGLLCIGLLYAGEFKPDSQLPGVCLTPGCVEAANSIISAIDPQTDPCDDFYQYACGGWIKRNPLPEGQAWWDTMAKLWDEHKLVVRNIIEDSSKVRMSHAEKLVKTYYSSCMDPNGTIEDLGLAPIEDLLKSIGRWSLTPQGFGTSKWELQDTIERAQNIYARKVFFKWSVWPDAMNSSRYVIVLDQDGLTLPSRENYLNETSTNKAVEALSVYIRTLGVLMRATDETARAQAKRVVDFERALAKIFVSALDRKDITRLYNRMKIAELQRLSPFLDWVSFFREGLQQVGIEIDRDTEVNVQVPSFFKNLSKLVQDTVVKRDGKTILANYIGFKTVDSLIFALSSEFRNADHVLQRELKGTVGTEAPWRTCIADTDKKLKLALSSIFIRHVFNKESKQDAQSMVDGIKTAFKDNLPHLDWMDEATRALAQEKAENVADLIAFPDFLIDPAKLDEKYDGLELKENAYLANSIKASHWKLTQLMKKLNVTPDRQEWEMSPLWVNAMFNFVKNHLEIPAGILQAPFYHAELPRSLNFGGIGSVMGHELIHGLDDQGREFDKTGNMRQWWNNRTIDAFKEQAKCFEEQYSQYAVDSEHLNGQFTLGENIADNGGMKASFRAYRSWAKHNKELPPLPGVNLTHEQLFYIGFAQSWCSTETPEQRHIHLLTDVHSLAKYRVIGTLSNSADFARTYNCDASTKMNPAKKCEIW